MSVVIIVMTLYSLAFLLPPGHSGSVTWYSSDHLNYQGDKILSKERNEDQCWFPLGKGLKDIEMRGNWPRGNAQSPVLLQHSKLDTEQDRVSHIFITEKDLECH